MAVDFRDHPMFPSTGFNTPTRFEADIYDCEVWGKVPSDIEGNFYRMQCDFQYRPPQNEWPTGFNGDGHISRFWFKDGNVNFRARYVKTARLIKVPLPMLVNWAELDPPDFVPDTEKMIADRKAAGMPMVSLRLPNHSHLSGAYAVGTADESLTGPILKFIEAPPK